MILGARNPRVLLMNSESLMDLKNGIVLAF